MSAPWPYDEVEPEHEPASSTPTWECPGGECACNAVAAEDELFEYSLLLLDELGEPMPGARCRVILGGCDIHEDAWADGVGWVTFTFKHVPKTVWVEWAPKTLPREPIYPFRRRVHIHLPESEDQTEAARRRLGNLGFSQGPTLEDDVAAFQSCFEYERITADIEDIADDLEVYHDQARAPRRGEIAPWDGKKDDDSESEDEEDEDEDDEAASPSSKSLLGEQAKKDKSKEDKPKKDKSKEDKPKKDKPKKDKPKKDTPKGKDPTPPRSNPPSKGATKKGGGQKPKGQGAAGPPAKVLIEVQVRARFWRKGENVDRWNQGKKGISPHVVQITKAKATISDGTTTVPSKNKSAGNGIASHTKMAFDLKSLKGKAFKGTLTITPHKDHDLGRTSSALVGPSDKAKTKKAGDCLWREVEFGIAINGTGEVTFIGPLPKKTVATVTAGPSTAKVTNARAIVSKDKKIVIVDWKPDFVTNRVTEAAQTKSSLKKSSQKAPTLDKDKTHKEIELAEDTFVVVHATLTGKSTPSKSGEDFEEEDRKTAREVGSTINNVIGGSNSSPPESPHYIIDDDGFIIKVANEDMLCTHAGGPGGAAWGRVIGRPSSSTAKPGKTVPSFNAFAVGIEHMHELISDDDALRGATAFSDQQMTSSAALIARIQPTFVVSHFMVAIGANNQVGTHKPACIGVGYKWSMVEGGRTFPAKFTHTFTSSADKQVEAYLKKHTQLDGTKHKDKTDKQNLEDSIKTTQQALSTIGFMMASIDGRFDSTESALKAFAFRCFGGSDRAKSRKSVVDSDGNVIANEKLISALFAVRDACAGGQCAP
ncbi:MAG: hypothetical protein HOW73_04130 [Polyangiaceae bacterium]|nr:hypothetical protein [Polyangiaceae bacterium]